MIIGIDCRTLQDTRYSGVSEYSLQLLTALFTLDQHNQYRLFFNSSQDLGSALPKFDYPNVTIQKFDYPNKLLNYFLILPFNKPWLDDLLGGVDLFFSPHVNFLAVSRQAKLLLTIHDLSFIRYPEFFSLRKNIWHRCLRIKRLARRADMIVTVSENTKADVVNLLKADPQKVKVIYSGIDAASGPVTDAGLLHKLKAKYSLPENFLLYLGTIEPRKNLLALIMAFELLKKDPLYADMHLVLAGGDGWKNSELYDYVSQSACGSAIKFIGYVERQEKNGLYSLARAFVYPSLYEGFGFPPLEAASCGTPVMTSYSSSLPEIVGPATVLANPYDLAELHQGLIEVLKLPRQLQKIPPTWLEAAASYLKLFEELDNGRAVEGLAKQGPLEII